MAPQAKKDSAGIPAWVSKGHCPRRSQSLLLKSREKYFWRVAVKRVEKAGKGGRAKPEGLAHRVKRPQWAYFTAIPRVLAERAERSAKAEKVAAEGKGEAPCQCNF